MVTIPPRISYCESYISQLIEKSPLGITNGAEVGLGIYGALVAGILVGTLVLNSTPPDLFKIRGVFVLSRY